MKPVYERSGVTIYNGNVIDVLKTLPAGSVQTVVTSPPYWGLRDYGIEPSLWGGNPECDHDFPPVTMSESNDSNRKTLTWTTGGDPAKKVLGRKVSQGTICAKCGAWCGCLGLEPTPSMFVAHMVSVFAEVWRVLRDDGTLWLNMGDCYATGAGTVGDAPGGGEQGARWKGETTRHRDKKRRNTNRGIHTSENSGLASKRIATMGPMTQPNRMPIPGLKPKDLVGVPWRVAFALQAAGWYLRSDIIWSKPNPMPESVTDRPTKAHEYIFLMTKSERYFYDHIAVREKASDASILRLSQPNFENQTGGPKDYANGTNPNNSIRKTLNNWKENSDLNALTRNKRTVWTVNPAQFPEAHFATFPEDLIAPCILAGTSERGCCAICSTPYKRIVEKKPATMNIRVRDNKKGIIDKKSGVDGKYGASAEEVENYGAEEMGEVVTLGWKPQCKHEPGLITRCTVLDPFFGSGTTGLVARANHCKVIGVDMSPEYIKIAEGRLQQDVFEFA